MDSLAEDEGPLPLGVIDPDAAFAVWWNLVQLVAVLLLLLPPLCCGCYCHQRRRYWGLPLMMPLMRM